MYRWQTTAARSFAYAAIVTGLLLSLTVGAQSLSHRPDPIFHNSFEDVAAGPFNDADAARFLAQATFGPTTADIAHLRSIGYQAWLTEQFSVPITLEMSYINWTENTLGERTDSAHRQEAWFLGALGGPDPQNNLLIHKDQLRQRVAFALSEILVVSQQNPLLAQFPNGLAYYYDILATDAFSNYRTLLNDITLSPAMGVYLNMLGNQRANLAQNIHPDENYAREINQLFSIGLVMLNTNGTPTFPRQATYTQSTISAFAHVLTGWNWSDCTAGNFNNCGPNYTTGANFLAPMTPFAAYHDNGTDAVNDIIDKQLLVYPTAANGGLLVHGGTPASDLQFALDNIFNHPNVGPFISKQLIQRLVTSNPTPSYVQRVATVFNNDGTAVRGNLKAVIQAILLDPEARIGQWQNPDTYGKLREPLLVLTHLWRAMGARHMCGLNETDNTVTPPIITKYLNQPYRYAGYGGAWNTQYWIGQMPLNANTVFNFFKADFIPPGEMTTSNLVGPEFQTTTDTTITTITSDSFYRGFGPDISDQCDGDETDFGNVKINHAQDFALAGTSSQSVGGAADPSDRLVDAYNIRFMSGQMSPFMRQTLITYLNTIDKAGSSQPDWRIDRIYRALGLILTSPEYIIQK